MERILEGSYCTLEHYSYSVLNDMSLFIEGIHVDKRLRKGATVVVPYQNEVLLPISGATWYTIYSESYALADSKDIQFYLTLGNIEQFFTKHPSLDISSSTKLKAEHFFYGLSYFSSLYSDEVLDAMYHRLCKIVLGECIDLSLIETTNWNATELRQERNNIEAVSPLLQKWKEIQEDQLQFHLQLQALDNKAKYGDIYGEVCRGWMEYAKAQKGEVVQDTSGDKSTTESAQLSDDLFKTLGEILRPA
jgi:hypothetical protein